MFYHAYGTDAELDGTDSEFRPCPFCGGQPDWLENPGNDFIMRCVNCHATTRTFRMEPEEAVRDWNNGDIENDNFSITEDTKIDDYLACGITQIHFKVYSNLDDYWPVENGFLCSDVVIETTDSKIWLAPDGEIFHYELTKGFNPDLFKMTLVQDDEEVKLLKTEWDGNVLLSLELKCGDKKVIIKADADEDCTCVLVF